MADLKPTHSPSADDVFADYERDREAGQQVDFEALCRAHPELAADLRMHEAARQLLARSVPGPLASSDDDASIGIAAHGEDDTDAGSPSELLGRLRDKGQQGSRYRVLGEIARGGMGIVLRVMDTELRRKLAMKVGLAKDERLSDSTPRTAPETVGRFLEEAQVTSQLDHPGIVPVHEIGVGADGRVFFTMRYVRGDNLRTVFARVHDGVDGCSQVGAVNVLLKVCDAMSYAHEKKVIHRDLKPANVMVGRFGEVYVMDWGLARVLGQRDRHDLRIRPQPEDTASAVATERQAERESTPDSPLVTMDGQVLGTPAYMSPEQAKGQVEKLGPQSDVYALGAMLYHLIAGQMPYVPADARLSGEAIRWRVVEGPPRPLHEFGRTAPAALVAICEKAMAREIEQRYPDMQSLASDLRAYVEGRVVRAYQTGTWAETRVWVWRNKALAATLLAAGLILMAGIAVTMVYTNRARESETLASARADENAKLAQEKTDLAASESIAKQRAQRSAAQLGELIREFDQFARVAGVGLYERAIANDAKLYPPWPSKIEAMERWLKEDAGKLLALKDEIQQTVRDLEARALPRTVEDQEADRDAHPRFPEFTRMTKCVESLRRAQAIRDGKSQLVVPELTAAQLALGASRLDRLAWIRVTSKPTVREVWGEEPLGLAYARAAVSKGSGTDQEHQYIDNLAWALLANGQDAEAKARSAQALAKTPDKDHEDYRGFHSELEVAVEIAAENLAGAERVLAKLTKAVNEQRTFRFELHLQGFLHDTLAELLRKLPLLEAKQAAVEARLRWAKQIQELTLAHPQARHTWAAARTSIGVNEKYAGREIELRDRDITGLMPIGENPVTKLWEFYELRSAWDGEQDPHEIAIPTHNMDGSIEVTGDPGIVFVLLPGGTFMMGAQKDDPNAKNFDPEVENDETLHEVTLAPFFLARHELTQGQWQRLAGTTPFWWKSGLKYERDTVAISANHPADSMNWDEANECMERQGLSLPTEAQWEYGCRAGQGTPWWTGPEAAMLAGAANLRDQTASKERPEWGPPAPFDDGFTAITRVGSYRGNPFGLYDMLGNVAEWCRDWYHPFGTERSEDGLRRHDTEFRDHVDRGGCFTDSANAARSASRNAHTTEYRKASLGLRPARALRP